eukprot:gnl/MRDRNA2_/MRDRNA2_93459_c0_seq1.p1 gnl/MRDRNA2_/MRDRNA2_93459_c0~~gnl/MRDRNA2_/MRDRNA2_93459_c0_seq1.p1  ORF type:complete len:1316 (-),score=289.11 gnl/MRDRNA2_/MRDRNA2_93459_c0_seq1:10-3957(-)
MDQATEDEIWDNISNLGGWFDMPANEEQGERRIWLCQPKDALAALKDLQNHLKVDDDLLVRLYLGKHRVFPDKLVPFFKSHRTDRELVAQIFKVMLRLTAPVSKEVTNLWMHIEHLQDAKEAVLEDKDNFLIISTMLVDEMGDAEQEDKSADNKQIDVDAAPDQKKGMTFEMILALISNLMMIPDPVPGSPGFQPQRKNMQLQYIRLFVDESFFAVFAFFLEKLDVSKNRAQAWAFLEVFYHVCTKVDPERACRAKKPQRYKHMLGDMLSKVDLIRKARTPQSSRHSRFGTLIERRATHLSEEGKTVVQLSHSVEEVYRKEGSRARGFRGSRNTESKPNLFLDPTFVDLQEGSCREHDRVNPYILSSRELPADLPDAVFECLGEFFCDLLGMSGNQANVRVSLFSQLVSFLRTDLKDSSLPARNQPGLEAAQQESKSKPLDQPRLLCFIAWVLEFHRHHHIAKVSEAKSKKQDPPKIDITAIQGAIDLDMLQLVMKLVGDHGKRANIDPSKLVITLRLLSQQIKTIGVVMESKDPQVKDIAEVLLANFLKDDVLGHLAWIMKNYRPTTHDPRVLTYSLEAFHCITRAAEKSGTKDFEVESGGLRGGVKASSLDLQLERLCNCSVVENLFSLLEKYADLSSGLLSILVRLIYRIIKMSSTNIVVFFEMTYFIRIERILDDPLISDKNLGKRYSEMVELLTYILRQFFKCAEKNKCVFVEMMFRKIPENKADALLGSFGQEFAAILDNYEQESYKEVLDKMRAGETVGSLKLQQKQLLSGDGPPWTAEEDAILIDKFDEYENHPLCCDLLAAELSGKHDRTAKMVRKRLTELSLIGSNRQGIPDGKKKRKALDLKDEEKKAKQARFDETDEIEDDVVEETGLDLENELERMMDEAVADTQIYLDSFQQGRPQTETQRNEAPPGQNQDSQESLEDELARLIDEDIVNLPNLEVSGTARDSNAATLNTSDTIASATATTLPNTSTASYDSTSNTHVENQSEPTTVPTSSGTTLNDDVGAQDDDMELDLERIMDEGFADDIEVPLTQPATATTAAAGTASTMPESIAATVIDATMLPSTAPCSTADTVLESTMATVAATATIGTAPESVAPTLYEVPSATVPDTTAASSTDDLFTGQHMSSSMSSEKRQQDSAVSCPTVPTPTRTTAITMTAASQDTDMANLEKDLESIIDNMPPTQRSMGDLEKNPEDMVGDMSPTKTGECRATTPAQTSRDARDTTLTPMNVSKKDSSFASHLSQDSVGLECELEKLIDEDLQPSCSQNNPSQGGQTSVGKDAAATQKSVDVQHELEYMIDHSDDDMD